MPEPVKLTRKEDAEKKLKEKITTLEEEGKKNAEKMLRNAETIADLKRKLAEASRNELKASPQPKPQRSRRGGARGGAPRRRRSAPRGRGYESRGSQDNYYPHNKYPEHDPDWGQYRGYDWKPRTSGAGRSPGPVSHP